MTPEMIALDPYTIAFIKGNFITAGLVLGFLKGLAKLTKSTTDDKVMTLLSNTFSTAKRETNK